MPLTPPTIFAVKYIPSLSDTIVSTITSFVISHIITTNGLSTPPPLLLSLYYLSLPIMSSGVCIHGDKCIVQYHVRLDRKVPHRLILYHNPSLVHVGVEYFLCPSPAVFGPGLQLPVPVSVIIFSTCPWIYDGVEVDHAHIGIRTNSYQGMFTKTAWILEVLTRPEMPYNLPIWMHT